MDREWLRQIERMCYALDALEDDVPDFDEDPFGPAKSEAEQEKDARRLIEECQILRNMYREQLKTAKRESLGRRRRRKRADPRPPSTTKKVHIEPIKPRVPPVDLGEWLKETIREDFEESYRETIEARKTFTGDFDD